MTSSGANSPSLVKEVKEMTIRRHRVQVQDIWLAFIPIILAIHTWSVLHVFEEVPAWINRLTVWELLGATAYTQVFALLESVFILALFIVLALLLPKRWFANQFVQATGLIVLVATLWAIAAHNYDNLIRTWGARDFLPWLILIVISLVLALVLVSRSEKVKKILFALIDRATVLSVVYLFIDSLSIIIILIRNLQG